jgi:hypothetical protein
VNNRGIPSTHAERKITDLSNKHSFTPYPSLSPYSQMDGMTERETNTPAVHGLEELYVQNVRCVVFQTDRQTDRQTKTLILILRSKSRFFVFQTDGRNKWTDGQTEG